MKKTILLIFTLLQINIWAIQVAAPKAPPSIPLLGMDIDLTLYQDVSAEGVPAIVRGRGDIYILPVNVGAKLYKKGADIRFLGTTSEGLLSLLSSEADALGELEGKKLYIGGQRSSPDVITRTILEERGIEADILYRSSPEIAKLLITGRIKNAVLPEPLATMVLAKNPNIQRMEELKDLWPGESIPQVGIFVIGSSLDAKEEEIEKFIEGYIKSLGSLSTEDIEGAIGKFSLNMSVEEFKSSLEYMNLTFERDRESVDNYLKKLNIEVGNDFYAW